VARKSDELGIRRVSWEDGLVLFTTTALVASRFPSPVVFEAGSGAGYSTLWIAYAMHKLGVKGLVYATERDPGVARVLRDNVEGSFMSGYVRVVEGDAVEAARRLRSSVHMAFIDIEKSRYIDVFRAIEPRVARGGVVLAHNVYLPDPKAVSEYISYVEEKEGWLTLVVPTRVGLAVSFKLY
jgi:predicted O-methyltransferase YrrM